MLLPLVAALLLGQSGNCQYGRCAARPAAPANRVPAPAYRVPAAVYAPPRPSAVADGPATFLGLANAARAARGVGPLRWDAGLVAMAARNQAINDTVPAWERLPDGSMTPHRGRGHHVHLAGQLYSSGTTFADAYRIWMHGGGAHAAALMNPRYSAVGVSISASGSTAQLR